VLTVATTAFLLLLLALLVELGRPAGPLTASALPGAAARGVLVLSRLGDRRRERLRGGPAGTSTAERPVPTR
jgi:hypothetical protein